MPNSLKSEDRNPLSRFLEPIAGLLIIIASIAFGYWMGYREAEIDYGHRPSEIEQLRKDLRELSNQPTSQPSPESRDRDGNIGR